MSHVLKYHFQYLHPKGTTHLSVRQYISDLLLSKHFKFNEVALSNKNGMAEFNYNSFFESSGSSLSTLFKDDTK